MKKISRVIGLVLSVTLFVGCLAIGSAAEKKTYDRYIAIGDSNAAGYGLDAYFDQAEISGHYQRYYLNDGYLIDGSYPELVGEELASATELYARCGWRTTELLRAFGVESIPGDQYDTYANYIGDKDFFMYSLRNAGGEIIDKLLDGKNSGNGEIRKSLKSAADKKTLVSLNIGTNDIFAYGIFAVYEKYAYIIGDSGISKDKSLTDYANGLTAILKAAKENELKGILLEFQNATANGLKAYKANLSVIIDEIRKMNPKADICVVGIVDPVDFNRETARSLGLPDSINLDVLCLTDRRTNEANLFTEKLCQEKNCIYAEVCDTECYGFSSINLKEMFPVGLNTLALGLRTMHPNEAGHRYMADQIVKSVSANQTAVTGLKAVYTTFPRKNRLTWNGVSGACRYRIYRATEEKGTYSCIAVVTKCSFTDLLIRYNRTYYYKVAAVMDQKGTVMTSFSSPCKAQ